MISGAGAPAGGLHAENLADAAPEELWRALAAGADPPSRLAEAFRRLPEAVQHQGDRGSRHAGTTRGVVFPPQAAGRGTEPDSIANDMESGIGHVRQAIHTGNEWCNTGYEDFDSESFFPYWINIGDCTGWGWDVCWDHVTGTGWAYHPDAVYAGTNVCPYIGSVVFTVESDEWGGGSWTVQNNTVRWWKAEQLNCDVVPWNDCPSIKSTVSNASGDAYNYRMHVAPD